MIKNPPANVGDIRGMCSILGLGRFSGGEHDKPTSVFLPGESHEQRSLVGYGPLGSKTSDTTEAT